MSDQSNDVELTDDEAVVAEAEAIVTEAATRIDPYSLTGMEVKGLDDLDEILAAGGADFTAVSLQPEVLTPEGIIKVPVQAILRDDDYSVVGVHKPGYNVIQYRQVAEIGLEAVNLRPEDNAISHVGVMKDGGQFYINIDLGTLVLDPNGIADKIERFLTVFSSHDGTLPVLLVPGNIRLACTNQLPSVRAKARSHGFVAKHTKNVLDKLSLAKQALGMADAAEQLFIEQAEQLLAAPASHQTVTTLVNKIWVPKDNPSDRQKTISASRMTAIHNLFDADTNAGTVGENRWAAYNAVTEYLDHGRGTTAEKRALATIAPGGHVEKAKAKALSILLDA